MYVNSVAKSSTINHVLTLIFLKLIDQRLPHLATFAEDSLIHVPWQYLTTEPSIWAQDRLR